MMDTIAAEAAAFFGQVGIRVVATDDGREIGTYAMTPAAAMDLSKQLARQARAAGWKKPGKP